MNWTSGPTITPRAETDMGTTPKQARNARFGWLVMLKKRLVMADPLGYNGREDLEMQIAHCERLTAGLAGPMTAEDAKIVSSAKELLKFKDHEKKQAGTGIPPHSSLLVNEQDQAGGVSGPAPPARKEDDEQ